LSLAQAFSSKMTQALFPKDLENAGLKDDPCFTAGTKSSMIIVLF